MTENWDVVIVGGGVAGLSAALNLARARRRVLVVDAGEPRNGVAPHAHGLLGLDGIPPLELLTRGRAEIEGYGGVIRSGHVERAEVHDADVTVVLDDDAEHSARHLLIATGLRDELPDVPGLAQLWGRGVVVCPYCDGWEHRDQRIGVLATGPGSVHQAQLLRQWSDRLVYLTAGEHEPDADAAEALAARGIEVERRPVARVVGRDGVLQRIEFAGDAGADSTDAAALELDVLFTGPTMVPNDVLLRALGAEADTTPLGEWVRVGGDGRTSVDRVWAAGNVVDPRANVPVAIGAGLLVAGALNADLTAEDVAIAVATSPRMPT